MAIDTHLLFTHAECFRKSAELLRAQVMLGKESFLTPFHMTDAFCCELFLKCLATIQTGIHPRGHDLDELFSGLPPTDQGRVEHHYKLISDGGVSYQRERLKSPSKSSELRSVLKDGAKLFEKIRYWYEGNFPDMAGDFRLPIAAIRKVIFEVHPEFQPVTER